MANGFLKLNDVPEEELTAEDILKRAAVNALPGGTTWNLMEDFSKYHGGEATRPMNVLKRTAVNALPGGSAWNFLQDYTKKSNEVDTKNAKDKFLASALMSQNAADQGLDEGGMPMATPMDEGAAQTFSSAMSAPGILPQGAYDSLVDRLNKKSLESQGIQREGITSLQERLKKLQETPANAGDPLARALATAADVWAGGEGNFSKLYAQSNPQMTEAQKQEAMLKLEDMLRKSRGDLADSEIDLLKAQLGYQMSKDKLAGGKEENLKENQWRAADFGRQMLLAEEDLNKYLGAGYDPTSKATALRSVLPGFTQGEDTRGYESAKQSFIMAKLRDESGASIGSQEYKRAEQTYFPQVGDSPQTLKEKARRRAQAINTMRSEAGQAWQKTKVGGNVDPGLAAEMQRRGLK